MIFPQALQLVRQFLTRLQFQILSLETFPQSGLVLERAVLRAQSGQTVLLNP